MGVEDKGDSSENHDENVIIHPSNLGQVIRAIL